MEADSKELEQPGEYYAKEGEGVWMGKGSEALGLEGAVTREAFQRMAEGYGPDGQALAQNAGDADRRAGWDLTFSAPKSVSVAFGIADPETRQLIEKAHGQAVEQAFSFMQEKAGFVRTGQAGQVKEQADLVAAAFQHGTSREQDAQLHTHVFVFNAGIREDGRAASITSEKLFEYKMAGGAAYQVALANEMQKLGYQIERDGEYSFRLVAVPRSLEHEASTRRQQIEAALREKGESGGKAAAVANLETRKAKEVLPRSELYATWRNQAERHGFTQDMARPDHKLTTKEKTYDPNHQPRHLPERSLNQARTLNHAARDSLRTLSERCLDESQRTSRLRPEEFLPRNAPDELDRGRPDVAAGLRRPDDQPAASPATADSGRGISPDDPQRTPAHDVHGVLKLATENDAIIRDADICVAAFRSSVTAQSLDQARELAQVAKGAAVAVERIDGTADKRGQTYTTNELIRAEKDVLNIAQSRAKEANYVLDKGAVKAAMDRTAAAKGYALNAEQSKALENIMRERGGVQVVIGDAGAGKSSTMHAVREAYEAEGFRVIGTSTGGKASAELMASSGIESHSLAKLHNEVEAGRMEFDQKTVIVLDEAGMVDSRAMAWVMREADNAGAKVLLVGDDKQLQPVGAGAILRHVADLPEVQTSHLQENQRQRHEHEREAVALVKEGQAFEALAKYAEHGQLHVASDFKSAAKEVAGRQVENIKEVGADKTVALAGTNVAVQEINAAIREQLKEDGQLKDAQEVKTKHASIELAEGDRVLFTAPDKSREYLNGDTGTVKGIDGDKLKIELDRTKEVIEVKASQADLQHGYCMTAHKAQGATLDKTTVYATNNMSQEMAYVMVTRDREGVDIVMSSHHLKEMKDAAPPTQEVREAVDKVISARVADGKKEGISAEARESYGKSLAYLEKNAAYAPPEVRERTQAAQIKDVAKAMGTSRQKESTLDYKPAKPEMAAPGRDGPAPGANPAPAPSKAPEPTKETKSTDKEMER